MQFPVFLSCPNCISLFANLSMLFTHSRLRNLCFYNIAGVIDEWKGLSELGWHLPTLLSLIMENLMHLYRYQSEYCRMPPLWGLPFQRHEDMWSSHNWNEASNLSDLVMLTYWLHKIDYTPLALHNMLSWYMVDSHWGWAATIYMISHLHM